MCMCGKHSVTVVLFFRWDLGCISAELMNYTIIIAALIE